MIRSKKEVLAIALGVDVTTVDGTNNPTIFTTNGKFYYVLSEKRDEYCKMLNNFADTYIKDKILPVAYGTPIMKWLNLNEIRQTLYKTPFYELLDMDRDNLHKFVVFVETDEYCIPTEIKVSKPYYCTGSGSFIRIPFDEMTTVSPTNKLILEGIYEIYETYNEGL